jgi:hypothetical protein
LRVTLLKMAIRSAIGSVSTVSSQHASGDAQGDRPIARDAPAITTAFLPLCCQVLVTAAFGDRSPTMADTMGRLSIDL